MEGGKAVTNGHVAGRVLQSLPCDDTWRSPWVAAEKHPYPRFEHSCCLLGNMMFVFGGNCGVLLRCRSSGPIIQLPRFSRMLLLSIWFVSNCMHCSCAIRFGPGQGCSSEGELCVRLSAPATWQCCPVSEIRWPSIHGGAIPQRCCFCPAEILFSLFITAASMSHGTVVAVLLQPAHSS
jgi:hypothetical protein